MIVFYRLGSVSQAYVTEAYPGSQDAAMPEAGLILKIYDLQFRGDLLRRVTKAGEAEAGTQPFKV